MAGLRETNLQAAASRVWRPRWIRLIPLMVMLSLTACGPDPEQASLCQSLLPALDRSGSALEIVGRQAAADGTPGVSIRYRRSGEETVHEVTCRFAGGRLDKGRLRLVGVSTDLEGPLSQVRLYMLRRYWLGWPEARARQSAGPADQKGRPSRALYFLQMLVNAVAVSSIYVLLATAYTLVFGVIRRINLAFGEIYMLGAYGAVIAAALLAALGWLVLPLVLIAAPLFAVAIGAVYGWTIGRVVFRPLLSSGTQAPLIASLGAAIFLQEYVRLAQGARVRWLQPLLSERFVLAGTGRFAVTVTMSQVLVLALTLSACAGLFWWLRASRAGRRLRACGDDSELAALCGVDAAGVTALGFMVSAGVAALGGVIVAIHYGVVGPSMGFAMGFKALVAAVLGGIGSVPGAMLGGLLLGLFETFWAGYLNMAYRDVAVFGVLAMVLIFRPYGLLGDAPMERFVPTFRW